MIYLGLKVFYHIHFTGIIIEMMITEVEETVMKGERKSRQGEILRLLHNIILYSKREQIYLESQKMDETRSRHVLR